MKLSKLALYTLMVILFSLAIGFENANIFWAIRFPTVLLAFFVGATLALCGLSYQNVLNNDLASPFTLGVASCASFGMALGLQFHQETLGAIGGSLGSVLILWGIYKKFSFGPRPLLIGIAINFLFSSLILLLQFFSDRYSISEILHWTMGTVTAVGYSEVLIIAAAFFIFFFLSIKDSKKMDLFTLGHEIAQTWDMNVKAFVWRRILWTTLALGVVVSFCGPIAFIGLMAPHMARYLFPFGHKNQIFAASLLGATLVVFCEFIAGNIHSQFHLPVGIICSFLGAIFFLQIALKAKWPIVK